MIGPLSPGTPIPLVAKFDGAPTLPGVELRAMDGGIAVAHTTALTDTGDDVWTREIPSTGLSDGFYFAVVDDNGTVIAPDEVVWISGSVATVGTIDGPGAVTPYTTSNPYKAKRGDTKPDFVVQLLNPDGSHYQIPPSSTVMLTVQKLATPSFDLSALPPDFTSTTRVYHHAVTSWTSDGLVTHEWAPGEITWIGYCVHEVEVTEPGAGGDVRSFPGAQVAYPYIPGIYLPDEDEGVNP